MSHEDPVVEYLVEQFQHTRVNSLPVGMRDLQEYHIIAADDHVQHRVRVSREFLDDHPPAEVKRLLASWDLVGKLTAAGRARLVVTNDGVKPDQT